MGLLTETNQQYYAGQQVFTATGVASPNEKFTWTGDTVLVNTVAGVSNTNYSITINGVAAASTAVENVVTLSGVATVGGETVVIQLTNAAMEANYGSYEYISMADVINNFLVAYVGSDKLIPHVKRTDVMFHAKRGLQEFSYDTLRSIKSQELTIPDSLSVIIPQDYVNYVQLSWIDDFGVKHIIYPTTLTGNPYEIPVPNADGSGIPTQNSLGENLQGASVIEERWDTANDKLISGDIDLDF